FQFSSWILNIPRGLAYFLPWLPLALLQLNQPVELRSRLYEYFIGIAIAFILVNLVPNVLPIFTLPALGPATWLMRLLLIHDIVPTNVPLYVVNPKYQPYLFYVRAPIRYVSTLEQLPADTKFFLVQGDDEEEAQTTRQWLPSRAQMVLRIKDYREREEVLFSV